MTDHIARFNIEEVGDAEGITHFALPFRIAAPSSDYQEDLRRCAAERVITQRAAAAEEPL
jgi:hypothetical protein